MSVNAVQNFSIKELAFGTPSDTRSTTPGQMQCDEWYEPTVASSRQQHAASNVATRRDDRPQVIAVGGATSCRTWHVVGQRGVSYAQVRVRPLSSFYHEVSSAEPAQYQSELDDINDLIEILSRDFEIEESEHGLQHNRRHRRSARIAAMSY
ncbi:hypothetical protein PG991_009254 [Apiospora marii]|uniref:Uncharacterized protein n=1 Tax=Apiospora marii TaxID=335849 RepID=A0ABR1RK79_9PEZI